MDTPPNIEAVYEAVDILYRSPDPSQKVTASRWLQDFQKSLYSWKVANDILQEKRSLESCYFASQTLRSKIQYSFHELPPESYSSLRESLIEHIRQTRCSDSTAVVMQLCLALADFALHMSSWHSPVLDLLNIFGETHTHSFLQILKVLPEEVNSSALRLGSNRRNQVLTSLRSVSDTVSDYLKYCLTNHPDNEIQVKILHCLASWISIEAGIKAEVISSIVEKAFSILKHSEASVSSQLHDAATDCLCEIFPYLAERDDEPSLEAQLLTGVKELEESFLLVVAHEDREKSVNLCYIFTEITEAFLEKVINSSSMEKPHPAIHLFDSVLKCMGHYDYEVIEKTFGLWHRLSDLLYQKDSETLNYFFKPYIHRLIVYLRRHCEMESYYTGLLDEGDDFVKFRGKVADLINDVAFISGRQNSFRLMFLSLQQPNINWNFTEATLFVMKALANQIISKENDIVLKVIECILNLPESAHVAVRYTAVLLLGELSEWLDSQEECLKKSLNFLLQSLQMPPLSTAAATALQNICCTCRDYMAGHFNCLLQIVQSMDTLAISNEAAIGLLKGVSLTLNHLPSNLVQEAIWQLCQLQIIQLNQLVENKIKPVKGTDNDPVRYFDRLATIFMFVNPEVGQNNKYLHANVLTNLWPQLSKACDLFQEDVRVMERCCRCLRFVLRCTGKKFTDILKPLVHQMVTLYQIHGHSCFLYLGSILVDEYGSDPECSGLLLNMLHAFVQSTMKIFEDINGLKNNPNTVEDLFRLCSRFLQTMPTEFLKAETFSCIWNCAIFACTLDHKEANSSVMKFLSVLVRVARNEQNTGNHNTSSALAKDILRERGQALVSTLLWSSVFHLHPYMLFDVADVILELINLDRVIFCEWLQLSLQSIPAQNSSGNVAATESQLSDFFETIRAAQSTEQIFDILKEFVHLFR